MPESSHSNDVIAIITIGIDWFQITQLKWIEIEYVLTVQDFQCIVILKCLNLVIKMKLLRLLR